MTNFAQNFFGKPLRDLTHKDIATYFAIERAETDLIEYKSFPQNPNWDDIIKTVCKAICGFLNGNGGILVFGAPAGVIPDGKKEKIFIGQLTPTKTVKGGDWLINKISTEISPMPKDVKVQQIEDESGAIYIIQIEESTFKPHQWNHAYYIRLDGQTKPAPHFIVQALMREIKYPDIRAVIAARNGSSTSKDISINFSIGLFNFSQFQNEHDLNYRIMLLGAVFADWRLTLPNRYSSFDNGGAIYSRNLIDQTLYYGMPIVEEFDIKIPISTKEVRLILTFGGRSTPAKRCEYLLRLIWKEKEVSSFKLEVIEENLLFEEKQSIDQTLELFRSSKI